jgi:hypothetical protein
MGGRSATFNAEITRSSASDPVFTAARAKIGSLIRLAPVNSVTISASRGSREIQ